jgi:hypoxanthine phosphoribosyltransferase
VIELAAFCVDVPLKYKGFDIPSVFVVEYGFDYARRCSKVPYVATLRPEVYNAGVQG